LKYSATFLKERDSTPEVLSFLRVFQVEEKAGNAVGESKCVLRSVKRA
jgi:hypothetical protein